MNEYAAVNFNILKQQFINTRRNFKLSCFCISKGQVHFGRFAFLLFFYGLCDTCNLYRFIWGCCFDKVNELILNINF